jgi:hypothetical protein
MEPARIEPFHSLNRCFGVRVAAPELRGAPSLQRVNCGYLCSCVSLWWLCAVGTGNPMLSR